ncbi:hypothetical protein DAETH_15580 [Deinococcus aetherius]|uniref:Uncharacterized protein n=1 Tax=Deinococcus aetherius TaxID=200252 RepID=A0ABN6RG06_9DEIO|nr:hypothetical protein [Deinococcus aetherius]BDP41589.1 hypothetical protein DAETH_15580 [Deinococcus aetherius]
MRGEVSKGHILHNVHIQFLARRVGHDDFLAYAPELETPWVGVDLTWLDARHGKAERPPWPSTHLYPSLEAFFMER